MSAFYVQHQQQSPLQPKIRQEGFQIPSSSPSLNAPPSPSTPFDTPVPFFNNSNVFPNAFKKLSDPSSMDFSETLASMMAADSPEDRARHGQHSANSIHSHHHSASSGVDFSSHTQQHLFDISAFPSHLNNFRGTPDSGLGNDSPVQHNFFGDPPLSHATADFRHHSYGSTATHPPILPRLNTMRTSSPSATSIASPSDLGFPGSPFSPTASITPSSTAMTSQSRSRSRTRTSTGGVRPPPAASRSRVGKKRTTSISSPSPPGTSSAGGAGGAAGSGMAIVIPDIRSPPPQHSPSTSWMFSPSSQQTAFSLPDGSNGFPGSYNPGGQSMSLGTSLADDKLTTGKEDAASKQAALLNEKRRRRRESHNAVERRRRDNINEKINELSTLIPDCLLVDAPGNGQNGAAAMPNFSSEFTGDLNSESAQALMGGGSGGGGHGLSLGDEDGGAGGAALKANKGIILRKSVDYIRYLQQLVRAQSTKNRELEDELAQYRAQGIIPSPHGGNGLSDGSGPVNNLMHLASDPTNANSPFGLSSHFMDFNSLAGGGGSGAFAGVDLTNYPLKEEPLGLGEPSQMNGHAPSSVDPHASRPSPTHSHSSNHQHQHHQHHHQLHSHNHMDASPSAGGSGSMNGSDLDDDEERDREREIEEEGSRGRNQIRQQARFQLSQQQQQQQQQQEQEQQQQQKGFLDGSALSEGDDESNAGHMDER